MYEFGKSENLKNFELITEGMKDAKNRGLNESSDAITPVPLFHPKIHG